MPRKTIMTEAKETGQGPKQIGDDVSELPRGERDVLVNMGWAVNVDEKDASEVTADLLKAAVEAEEQAKAREAAQVEEILKSQIEAQTAELFGGLTGPDIMDALPEVKPEAESMIDAPAGIMADEAMPAKRK